MRTFRRNVLSAAILSCFATGAAAEDELIIHAFRNGAPVASLSAVLDGTEPQPASANGSFVFDLSAGPHSLQLLDNGQPIHVFRFDSADGQNVDIAITLADAAAPKVELETYFQNESAAGRVGAQPGSITGRVTLDGEPLADAAIVVRGTTIKGRSAADGIYALELPRGAYQIEVTHPRLGGVRAQSVRVVAGIDRSQNLSFSGAAQATAAESAGIAQIDEIIVVARRRPRGEQEQTSINVIETINAEELARGGGSDVAASVIRVPSITIQNDRYVFIRGLGDRYVSTTLNGATMPSTDPSKRTVPLDLFPTNIVSQLDVRKTFVANMPGESTGGNLVINTRTFPSEAGGSMGLSIGYTDGLTGQKVYTDPTDGSWDVFGVDDGSREENGLLQLISTALDHSDEYSENTLVELQRAGGILIKDDLDLATTTATPKGSLNLNYGDVFDIGETRLGYFAAGNFSNGWSQRTDGVSRTYGSGSDLLDDFKFEESTNSVEASGLLALGLSAGVHSFSANTLLSRATDSSVRVSEGTDGDEGVESSRYRIEWVERQFISQQLSGQHGFGALLGKWQITGSQARRYAPDRREVRFDLRTGDDIDSETGAITDGVGPGTGIYNLKTANLVRRYDELTDDNWDFSTDWSYDFGGSKLSSGVQVIQRERDAESHSYGFRGAESNAPNLLVSDVINLDSITGDQATGYAFDDKTLPSDSYQADLKLYAGYLSYDLRLGDYQLVAGGRYEDFDQTTDTFSLEGDQLPVQSPIDESIFLPSLAFNWFISDERQLRAAVSRTVARPDFKETSNATFYDTEFDFRVRGNPNLKVSEVNNFDLRFEQYWGSTENASIALFYKDLKDPIERVAVTASGSAGNTRTFRNSDGAEIYGIEIDGRKEFSLNEDYTRSFFVAVNASYIESEVEFQGEDSRKLQGQPDYTANLIVGYDDIPTRQQVTLLLNQNGESIQDVGTEGNPDIIEEPRLSLNFNYRYEVLEGFAVKFKAINLLDSEVEFTQGGKVFQRYSKGTELEAGIDWKF